MPMTIRFPDGREYDVDAMVEGNRACDVEQYVDENTRVFTVQDEEPPDHCPECYCEFFEAGCSGPVNFLGDWYCRDCKRIALMEAMGIRDADMGERNR
jgi:hypothetical protein